MANRTSEIARSVALTERLRARMLPLAVMLTLTLTVSAPSAFLAFGLHEQKEHAVEIAQGLAAQLDRVARQDERLWTYNATAILDHARSYRSHRDLVAVELLGGDGNIIGGSGNRTTARLSSARTLWAVASVGSSEQPMARVWVALDTARVYRHALFALGLFAALGIAMGWLIYTLPIRTASRAEQVIDGLLSRLEASRRELAELNEELEQRVTNRSEELSVACRQLEAQETRLRKVSGEAIELQETERRAIARELHDAVGQALTAVRINAQLIYEHQDQPARTTRLAEEAVALVDEALEEVRRAVAFLGPAILDEIGLVAAVERHCADFTERTSVPVLRTMELGTGVLPPAVESTCYRVVQEALTNVAKHASATQVELSLHGGDGQLSLDIGDDGLGMTEAAHMDSGRGLAGIRERVYLLGGTVRLDTAPGKGTLLHVTLPTPSQSPPPPAEPRA